MKIFRLLLALNGIVYFNSGYTYEFITLQSTTSTQNSGLYEAILPIFEEGSGIRVHVVAVGTGQALKNAKNGDGDVLLVHSKSDEDEFIANGFGIERFDVMYNDFVIVGPSGDPAGIRYQPDSIAALKKITMTEYAFISRGDNSGTHKKERSLWREAGVDPTRESGKWYWETGSGMGATLNIAVEAQGYTLTDRGTWISFRNKKNVTILHERDEKLFNQYGIILVSPQKHPHVKQEKAQIFIDWILGEEGQGAINAYQLDGEQLFFANAKKENERSLSNAASAHALP